MSSGQEYSLRVGLDKLQKEISKLIGQEWKSLARNLGLTETDIASIKQDSQGHLEEEHFQLFYRWRRQKGTDATGDQLLSAIMNIDVYEYILDELEKEHIVSRFESNSLRKRIRCDTPPETPEDDLQDGLSFSDTKPFGASSPKRLRYEKHQSSSSDDTSICVQGKPDLCLTTRKKFEERFLGITRKVLHYLKDHDMEIESFKRELVIAVTEMQEFSYAVLEKCLDAKKGKNVKDHWTKLNKWWNFLVFELLEQTIHIICVDDSDESCALRTEIKLYREDIIRFCENTKLKQFLNLWHGPRLERKNVKAFVSQAEVKLKDKWENYTLIALRDFSLELMKELMLPTGSFNLHDIIEGCILVSWDIPPSVADELISREALYQTSKVCFRHQLISLKVINKAHQVKELFTYSENQTLLMNLYSYDLREHYKSVYSNSETGRVCKPMFITLAKINDEEVLYYFQPDDFIKSTIRGDSSDIWHRKTPYNEDSLAASIMDPHSSRLILIEGVPGSGKTFLCWKFVEQWTEGTLSHYSNRPLTFVLLQLRDEGVKEIADLCELFAFTKPKVNASQIVSEENDGEGFVFWLDGWDEVYNGLTSNSVLRKLVSGKILPKAKVIVTSRPHGAKDVLKMETAHCRSRYEMVTSVKSNIDYAFDLQSEKDFYLLEKINEQPAIKSAMHTPLATSITRDVFDWCQHHGHTYPRTSTELYTAYVCMLISDVDVASQNTGLADKSETVFPIKSWSNVERLVPEHSIKKVCVLAREPELVFPHEQLPKDTNEHLLVRKKPLYGNGEDSFHFVHYTVQEFLKAYWIYLYPHKQTDLVKAGQFLIKEDRHTLVRRFLAGISHLQRFDLQDLTGSKCDFKHIFHVLFEAGKAALQKVLNKNNIKQLVELSINRTLFVGSDYKWNSSDYYVAGFCLAHSSCDWTLDFSKLSANQEEIEFFLRGLSVCSDKTSCIKRLDFEDNDVLSTQVLAGLPSHFLQRLEHVDLSHNRLDQSMLVQVLPIMSNLSFLSLWGARSLGQDKLQAMDIIDCLFKCRRLQHLELSFTFIGDEDCKQLGRLLESCDWIQRLDICNNSLSIESTKVIVEGLLKNKSLTFLNIGSIHYEYSCVFTPSTLYDLSCCLCSTNFCALEHLNLCNCNLTPDSAVTLATGVAVNMTLKSLILSINLVGDKGAASLAEALKQNSVLQTLELDKCKINSYGAVQLSRALTVNNTLKELVLSHNKIGNSGITRFAQILKCNSSLEVLWLHGDYSYNSLGVVKLKKCLEHNLKIKVWLPATIVGEPASGPAPAGIRRYEDLQGHQQQQAIFQVCGLHIVRFALQLTAIKCFKPIEVFYVTHEGGLFKDNDLGLRIYVPPGAVRWGATLHLEIGMCYTGPFNFCDHSRQLSPILMLHPWQEIPLEKPLEVTLPHNIEDVGTDSDVYSHGIRIMKADCLPEISQKLFFSEIDEEEIHSHTEDAQGYATFSLSHFCFISLGTNRDRECAMMMNYSLCPMIQTKSGWPKYYNLVLIPDMKPCLMIIKELFSEYSQVLDEKHMLTGLQFTHDPANRGGRVIAKIANEVELLKNGWNVSFTESHDIIHLDQWDFWTKIQDEHTELPPNFCICIQKDDKCSLSQALSVHLITVQPAGDEKLHCIDLELPLH